MRRGTLAWLAILSAGCLALMAGCRSQGGPIIQDGTPVPDALPGTVVNLEQGWSEEQQQWFWFTSQGSRIVPYDWFLALEQATSTELFRSDANMNRLRYLLEKPSPANPDGLPVGFAKDTDPASKKAWMGWTCAACHTNQIDYQGTSLRIDGAPTMADAFRFLDDLVAALQATEKDGAKFDRFAHKVLGGGYNPGNAAALRQELLAVTGPLAERQRQDAPPHPYGYARLDAFGGIFNQVLGADLGIPENYQPADAPVSFPFLWDTPQSDLVQWDGIAPNAGVGPLARNVGEILGVFGTISIDPSRELEGYKTSVKVVSLGDLEKTLDDLWSPLWPAEYLPPVDPVKAASGQAIYQQHCVQCHALLNRTDPKRRLTVVMTAVTDLGTDPKMADNVLSRVGRTGRLKGHKTAILFGETFGDEASGHEILGNAVIGTILGEKDAAVEAAIHEYLDVKKAATFAPASYKGRSLNGIWATAPYLHNGSVPNLWELLKLPAQRVQQFYVGSRELDPVKVGFETAQSPFSTLLDTRLPGNSNAGHNFGATLSDEQKWALIEYLKSL
jgi:hypothetical protein